MMAYDWAVRGNDEEVNDAIFLHRSGWGVRF